MLKAIFPFRTKENLRQHTRPPPIAFMIIQEQKQVGFVASADVTNQEFSPYRHSTILQICLCNGQQN